MFFLHICWKRDVPFNNQIMCTFAIHYLNSYPYTPKKHICAGRSSMDGIGDATDDSIMTYHWLKVLNQLVAHLLSVSIENSFPKGGSLLNVSPMQLSPRSTSIHQLQVGKIPALQTKFGMPKSWSTKKLSMAMAMAMAMPMAGAILSTPSPPRLSPRTAVARRPGPPDLPLPPGARGRDTSRRRCQWQPRWRYAKT